MTAASITTNPYDLLVLPVALYAGLAFAVARRQAWSSEIKLAVAGTGIVLVSAWLISFAALMAFFQAAYIEVPLNALGPVAVDGEMAVGTIVWIAVGQGGIQLADVSSYRDAFRWLLSPRPYVALLVAGAAALSAIANASHPYTASNHWPSPWSYIASGVPGVVMFAVIHQLVILFRVLNPEPRPPARPRRPSAEPLPEPGPKAQLPEPPSVEVPVNAPGELSPEPERAPAETEVQAEPEPEVEHVAAEPANGRRNGRRRTAVTLKEAKSEYRKLAAKGKVTGSALGDALDVSDVMGRIWKRRVEAEVGAKAERNRSFRFQGVAA